MGSGLSFGDDVDGVVHVPYGSYVNGRTMAERLVRVAHCKVRYVRWVRTAWRGRAEAAGPDCRYQVEAWGMIDRRARESSRSGGAVAAMGYLDGSPQDQLVMGGD